MTGPPQDLSVEQEQDDPDGFVEIDPSGRYGRYKEVLGRGAFKKVYRAFDELEGIEVAWNQIKVADLLRNSVDMERLYSEVHLLKTLKHKNIIKFYHSWVDSKNETINFITEIFTSGTLRQYRKKHKHVDLRALKKWSRQILEGLAYLHCHDPPVIHRDLKCDNIFINGNQGEVKIADLGLAAILHQTHLARSVIGTPEFMAPELYEEEYNELVDIYAFGMCLLELVTFEYPYIECANAAQIYKKVTSGIKPASLAKVENPEVRIFIEKCIAKVSDRLTAEQLLEDPFLRTEDEAEILGHPLPSKAHHSDASNELNAGKDATAESSIDLTLQGQRKDINTIFLKLRITDSTGHLRNIHFPFDIEADTPTAVATEMVEELDLTDQDVSTIAEMIDSEIRSHIPDWTPIESNEEHPDGTVANVDDCVRADDSFALSDKSTLSAETDSPHAFSMETLPSGRKYWSAEAENSPTKHHVSESTLDVDTSGYKESPTKHDQNGHASGDCQEKKSDGDEDSEMQTAMEKKIKNLASKLEELLAKHEEELNELTRKHELAVSALLQELPPDTLQKVLSVCKSKVADLKLCRDQPITFITRDEFLQEF